ncbi:MAG: hypothetical protein ACJAT2_002526 [Bacteriovoracaceae bacterium]|jgi:uncharacterized protein (TIGR02147 family)
MQEVSENPRISIFDFDNYRDFLIKAGMPDGLYSHTSNNFRSWAKRLGYKSASSLTMVIKGQRSPSFEMIRNLSVDLKMTAKETQYFELLIQLEKATSKNRDQKDILKKISSLSPKNTNHSLDLNEFSSISEWYFFAIKQLINTNDFVEDYEWIYKRLRKKVTISQIRSAIDIMLELKTIKRSEEGKLIVLKEGLSTASKIPSSAVRKHHFGMINRALEAVTEQDISERQLSSLTLRIESEKVDDAKAELLEFMKSFNQKYSAIKSDELFQLNFQFFQHTKEIYKH